MPANASSYFVIPIVRDDDGQDRLGSRMRCLSYANAIGLARTLADDVSGAIVLDADSAEVVAVFGDASVALQAMAKAMAND